MRPEDFDLNDIEHEPSDEQLASLMNAVAVEARQRSELARSELMRRLQLEFDAAVGAAPDDGRG